MPPLYDPRTPVERAVAGIILLYGRVSATGQVGNYSQEYQTEELFKQLVAMGASPDRIRLIADWGVSSTSGAYRSGWNDLIDAILEDEAVTAVAAAEISRLGRKPALFLDFLNIAKARGIAIIENGTVHDLNADGAMLAWRTL